MASGAGGSGHNRALTLHAVYPYLLLGTALWAAAWYVSRPTEVPTTKAGVLLLGWGFSQAVLLNIIAYTIDVLPESLLHSRAFGLGIWLTAHLLVGLALALVIESRAGRRNGVWRRALLAWLVTQAAYSTAAAILVSRGVIE